MSARSRFVRRVVRPLARVIGVPVAVLVMSVLRLSGRRAGVALMYHSVDQRWGDPTRELVPPHHARLFESQLRHLSRHYDIVPADRLQAATRERRRGQRFPVAITFDDDLACHESVSLPILRRLGVTATFFLSGASLDQPFSFHFERLQRAWDSGASGLAGLMLGPSAPDQPLTLHALATAIFDLSPDERDAAAEKLLPIAGPDPETAGIRRSAVRALASAGMTVGFHTYRHDALTGLSDTQLGDAMRAGRVELSNAAGAPVDVIGYPGGRADERVAAAARAAGFRIGYTTRRVPVTPEAEPLLLGRVGPSLRSVGALALEVAVTLVRPKSARSTRALGRDVP